VAQRRIRRDGQYSPARERSGGSRLSGTCLRGHARAEQLIGNHTRWDWFRTVSCDRSYYDNVVLIGDAANTAHYSVGSGTKLAMEDAIALVDAIDRNDGLQQAFEQYEKARRLKFKSLQEAAHRSQAWWDFFSHRIHLPVETVLFSYMTRTSRVDLDRLHAIAPRIVQDALVSYAGEAPHAGDTADPGLDGSPGRSVGGADGDRAARDRSRWGPGGQDRARHGRRAHRSARAADRARPGCGQASASGAVDVWGVEEAAGLIGDLPVDVVVEASGSGGASALGLDALVPGGGWASVPGRATRSTPRQSC